jgi:hypothetical protein
VVPTTTGSVVIDLQSATYFGGAHYQSRFVRLRPDAALYYFWTNNASATLDETASGATTRNQQCDYIAAFERVEEVPAGRYIVVKGSAGKLRISIVNQGLSR